MQRITSAQNAYIKTLVTLRRSSAQRKKIGRALVSGANLVGELSKGPHLRSLLTTDPQKLPKTGAQVPSYLVTREVMKKLTGLQGSPQLAAEVAIPEEMDLRQKKRVVVLDGIGDPGNAGTLLRTALAFGWSGAFLTPSCVDPFNDKVIRASRGALFSLPFSQGPLDALLSDEGEVLIADVRGDPVSPKRSQGPMRLVLGHETRGASREAAARGRRVSLPMRGEMESLNVAVAGGILLYLLGPQ